VTSSYTDGVSHLSMSSASALAAVVSVVTLIGCSRMDWTAPVLERVRGPAIVLFYGDTSSVSLPASARVGVPFSITVTSFGGGCIAHGETEVTLHALESEVRPHRYEAVRLPPNVACTMELRIYRDTVSLVFGEPGEATVRVVGIRRPGDTLYIIERRLPVRP
jgi:hypothetical protein